MKGGAPLPFFARISFHGSYAAFSYKNIILNGLESMRFRSRITTGAPHFVSAQKLDFVDAAKVVIVTRKKRDSVKRRKLISGLGSPVDSTGVQTSDLLVDVSPKDSILSSG